MPDSPLWARSGSHTPAYRDRRDAGQRLAQELSTRAWDAPPSVLALPRGGVPVAYEVAAALEAPLDVLVVRKLGAPGHEELAIGALASGGAKVLNEDLVRRLGVDDAALDAIVQRELGELRRRESVYRRGMRSPAISGRTVVIVDDGVATGATASAAVEAVKALGASSVIVAVPVGPSATLRRLSLEADEVVCPTWRDDLSSVGEWYRDFSQTSDAEVVELLASAAASELKGGPAPTRHPKATP